MPKASIFLELEKGDFLGRAYSKAFEPWQWVVGTGNYVDELESLAVKNSAPVKEIFQVTRRLLMIAIVVAILLLIVIALLIVS